MLTLETEYLDPCNPNPCQNGGYCNKGRCTCPENYSGPYCETWTGNILNFHFFMHHMKSISINENNQLDNYK